MDEKQANTLLRQAKAGDVEAFAQLFEALRPTVFRVACRLVGPDEADDAVMESYLKAWKALPGFKEGSSLKTWLFRITHNCALDLIRARQRRPDRVQTPAGGDDDERPAYEAEDSHQPTPAEALALHDQSQIITRAFALLDETHRTTLLLRFADNLSYAEIAAATGANLGTVMSRLFNGRRKLRKLIEQLEMAPPSLNGVGAGALR